MCGQGRGEWKEGLKVKKKKEDTGLFLARPSAKDACLVVFTVTDGCASACWSRYLPARHWLSSPRSMVVQVRSGFAVRVRAMPGFLVNVTVES